MSRAVHFIAALLPLALAACDATGPSGPGRPARMELVAGDLQTGVVGAELAQPLAVRVTDAKGKPVPDQVVNFVVVAGGGSVFAGAAQTNASGEARERWTLGTVAGDTQRVEVRAVDPATGQPLVFAVFRAIGLPDASARVERAGAETFAGTVGTAVADSLAVKVVDRWGNGVPGVQVAWAATAGGGTFSPASSVTGPGGIARAQWTLGTGVGAQAAAATVAGMAPVPFTATAGPGAPVRVQLLPDSLRFRYPGQRIPFTVQAFDAFGNPVSAQATIVSLDASVVKLEIGAVLATGVGSTRIVATVPGGAADTSHAVVVLDPAERVNLFVASGRYSHAVVAAVEGGTAPVFAVAYDASNRELTKDVTFQWSSSNPGVATVDSGGTDGVSGPRVDPGVLLGRARITGRAPGTAYVRVRGGSIAVDSVLVRVYAPLAARSVDVSSWMPCGVGADGAAYCWGYQEWPDVFASVWGTTLLAKRVAPAPTFTQVTAGSGHACGLTSSGAAYCWEDGALGTVSATPQPVAGGLTFAALSAGAHHTCGVTASGGLYCWGRNHEGQLATGDSVHRLAPTAAGGSERFTAVSANARRTCALTTGGQVRCWGFLPDVPGALPPLASVTAGWDHTCGLTADGVAYCWGKNGDGQLGAGTTSAYAAAVAVSGGFRFRMLAAGTWVTCGVTTAGRALCWGLNFNGRLGDGTTVLVRPAPTPVAGGIEFASVSAGSEWSCGVTPQGAVYCWGETWDGAFTTPRRIGKR